MSRKRPTQVELERELAEAKRRIQQLEKRLKQALRFVKQSEEIQFDNRVALDLEAEKEFTSMLVTNEEREEENYLTFTLPNGTVKRFPKRTVNE